MSDDAYKTEARTLVETVFGAGRTLEPRYKWMVEEIAAALRAREQKGIWTALGEAQGYGLSESARAEILMGHGMENYGGHRE